MMRRQFAAHAAGDHAAADGYKRRASQLRRARDRVGDRIAARRPNPHAGTYDPRTGGYYTGD